MELDTEKIGGFVPELYFDLIARVIPASIALTLYFLNEISQNISLSAGLLFLFFSYFSGYCADVFSRLMLLPLLEGIFDLISKLSKRQSRYRRTRKLLGLLPGIPSARHDTIRKLLAESAMLRVAATLCLLMAFVPPKSVALTLPPHFLFAGVFCIFVIGHINSQMHVLVRIEGERDANDQKP
jgi:uncharacterized membrane protein HdeD (DUF308 family)